MSKPKSDRKMYEAVCAECGETTQVPFNPAGSRYPIYCRKHLHLRDAGPGKTKGLPSGYLSDGYFDEKGNLRPELIGEQARQIAIALSKDMKASALRRFYGKVKFAQRKLESTRDFQAVLPTILELEPYVNNAVTRDVVSALFQQFVEANLTLAKRSEKAFSKGFAKHFEYVVAFFPQK